MKYVVDKVPPDKCRETLYYCHMKGYPDIPVFGSIGDFKKAKHVCVIMNGGKVNA